MVDYLNYLFGFVFSGWWFFLPFFLYYIVRDKHISTIRFNYLGSRKYSYLEIKIPPEVTRSPKAMEEVINSLAGVYRGGNWWTRFVTGYIPEYYIFYLVLHDYRLRLYIRCLEERKDFVASRIYSQYPDASVDEVKYPLAELPPEAPNPTFDLFGSEFKLTQKSFYPLRTYEVWERLPEEQRIDPISVLSEGANHVSEREWLIFQIFAMPITGRDELWGGKFLDEGNAEVDKLIKRAKEKEPGPFDYIAEFVVNIFRASVFRETKWEVGAKSADASKELPTLMQHLSPIERERVEAIEKKLGKSIFWSAIRAVYVATRDVFDRNMSKNVGLIFGTFKIFDGFNSLVRNENSITSVDYPTYFYKEKIFYRKKYLYSFLKGEWRPADPVNLFILSSDEIASLFHVPMGFVPPPGIEREAMRKIPPPPTVALPEV
jgi:hypothetical protein